jgi:hypothetical protein
MNMSCSFDSRMNYSHSRKETGTPAVGSPKKWPSWMSGASSSAASCHLPVRHSTSPYHLGLWAEVSEENFTRIFELWGDPAQATQPALSGSLATAVPLHPETIDLSVAIQLVGANRRPALFLMPLKHSLFNEQSRGIHVHRAFEYADGESRAAGSKFPRVIPVLTSNTGGSS